MTTAIVMAVLLSLGGREPPLVEKLEIQEVLDSRGKVSIHQAIYWRLQEYRVRGELQLRWVVAQWEWCSSEPISRKQGDRWHVTYRSKEKVRQVLACVYVRTVDTVDHERENLAIVRECCRWPYDLD